MRIFVYEHITGGGCLDAPLPEGLLPEALLMLHALIADLADCSGTQAIGLRDHRVDAGALPGDWAVVHSRRHWEASIDEMIRSSDATWPIAPETAGVLEDIARRVVLAGRQLIGSSPDAVHTAASKFATARALERAGVAVVPTFHPDDRPQPSGQRWIVKPDDGCGCEEVRLFADLRTAVHWLKSCDEAPRYVLQPYTLGEPLSLSVLGREGRALLLSVNRQDIALQGECLRYCGCTVNSLPDTGGRFQRLAQGVVTAIPGLCGYFGVDLILTGDGPFVVDVNPRLTTSYAGLREGLGINAARMVLSTSSEGGGGHSTGVRGRPVVVSPAHERRAAAGTLNRFERPQRMIYGWDLGGAHVKLALVDVHGEYNARCRFRASCGWASTGWRRRSVRPRASLWLGLCMP